MDTLRERKVAYLGAGVLLTEELACEDIAEAEGAIGSASSTRE